MLCPYNKPYLNIDQQINLLQERGMVIEKQDIAKKILFQVDYYRLSQYWYRFRKNNNNELTDDFLPQTTFELIFNLYDFDRKLRFIIMEAIEFIEITLRTRTIFVVGQKGPFAHRKLKPSKYNNKYLEWIEKINTEEEHSNENFVDNFKKKYSGDMPIWISAQLWSFGTLSKFISYLELADKNEIADSFGIKANHLGSWIRSLNLIRNICAHHGRLWDRQLHHKPKKNKHPLLEHAYKINSEYLYFSAAIIQFLLGKINKNNDWGERFKNHINSFPQSPRVNIKQAAFPPDWQNQPLWN